MIRISSFGFTLIGGGIEVIVDFTNSRSKFLAVSRLDGFVFSHEFEYQNDESSFRLFVPFVGSALYSCIGLVLVVVYRYRVRQLINRKLVSCSACGYNLSSSIVICSECGLSQEVSRLTSAFRDVDQLRKPACPVPPPPGRTTIGIDSSHGKQERHERTG